MNQNLIYLDNNATTQVAPELIEKMAPYFTDYYFNPSSIYEQSKITKNAIEDSRKTIAVLLGAAMPVEIIFTGSASESNNTAIKGALSANPGRRHVITTAVEHPSVIEVCKDIERNGYEVTYLKVNRSGELDIKEVINSLRPDTALVSIMHANNETGVIFPIEKLSKLVKLTDKNILFHTDATQTIGKLPINLSNNFRHVDLLSFSGHKIHAPKGIGVIYIRKGSRCKPLLIGGHQEYGRRAGTENVPYIVALASALELSINELKNNNHKIKELRDYLENSVIKEIPAIFINGLQTDRLDNTSSISFECIEGEGILYSLNEYGICASTGSACSSGSLAPSHVLQAMNIPFTAAHGTIRFSLSRYSKKEEIDSLLKVLPKVIANLRNISPYWDRTRNLPKENII